jgi:release factor glutamine methyltransferase
MVKLTYKNYVLDIPRDVYEPSEDTTFFLNVLKEKLKNKIYKDVLEIGVGNLFLSLEVYDHSNQLYALDIDSKVINYVESIKKKYNLNKLKIYKSDLFEKILYKKFDLILFNPPYVPSESIKFYSTDGGKDGSEIIYKFINSLYNHLKDKGVCYLLVTSNNNLNNLYKQIIKNHLSYKILKEENLFFEKLIILEIKKCQQM